MQSSESNVGKAIEIDGIRFETIMPQRKIPIPPKQADAKTNFDLEIQITNGTSIPHRFLLFYMSPEFRDEEQQPIQKNGPNNNGYYFPQSCDFQLVMPGEAVSFTRQGRFFWTKDRLALEFREKSGATWVFSGFSQGFYYVQLIYENQRSVWRQENVRASDIVEVRDVWVGHVLTTQVQFYSATQ